MVIIDTFPGNVLAVSGFWGEPYQRDRELLEPGEAAFTALPREREFAELTDAEGNRVEQLYGEVFGDNGL